MRGERCAPPCTARGDAAVHGGASVTLTTPRWLTRIAGPHSLSVPAWLVVSATSVTWSVAFLTSRASMSLPEAAGWGALAALVLGATWWMASKTWMKGGTPTRRKWLILPTYLLAAFIRSLIPVLASGSPEGPRQLPFAVASVTVLSVAATLAVDSYRELLVQNGRLAAIRDALAASESRAQVEAATLRASARQAITAAIEHALADDATGEDRALRLRRVSDEVVRPLSHALSGHQEELPATVAARPRRDLWALGRSILDAQPIRPWPTASLVTVMSLGIMFMIVGAPTVILAAATLWVVLAALLWALQRLPWQRLPVTVGMIGLPVAFAAAGLLALTLIALRPAAAAHQVPRGAFILAVMTVIAGSLVAVLAGVIQQQRQLEEELITEGTALVSARRHTQARIRRERRHLARILHGVVQPRIVARSLQLEASGEPTDVHELARELDALLSDEAEADRSINVSRALRDIAEVWSGSKAIVEITAPPDLQTALAAHPATARAVVDVTCEAVNNAILRVGATRVHADVVCDQDSVSVAVSNDVRLSETTVARGPGLGSALFDELTDEWSLDARDGRAAFTARIALPQRAGTGSPHANDSADAHPA